MNRIIKDQEEIENFYKIHNIVFEKAELYCDFFVSLCKLIGETYFGHNVLISEDDKMGHFKWCYNKTIENFEKENIFFSKKGKHFEILWIFFRDSFYFSEEPNKIDNLINYFRNIMKINYLKTEMNLNILHNFYKILDENLKS